MKGKGIKGRGSLEKKDGNGSRHGDREERNDAEGREKWKGSRKSKREKEKEE